MPIPPRPRQRCWSTPTALPLRSGRRSAWPWWGRGGAGADDRCLPDGRRRCRSRHRRRRKGTASGTITCSTAATTPTGSRTSSRRQHSCGSAEARAGFALLGLAGRVCGRSWPGRSIPICGRSQRTPTVSMRRRIPSTLRGCSFPGCGGRGDFRAVAPLLSDRDLLLYNAHEGFPLAVVSVGFWRRRTVRRP